MNHIQQLQKKQKRNTAIILVMLSCVLILGIACLFAGSSNMSFSDALNALTGKGSAAIVRIIWKIRVPRVLAAIIAGAGLSVAGLIMQTTLNNSMAAPSTLGVSNKVGQQNNPSNFLLMHALGPNVAGVIGSAIAAGFLLSVFG